MEWNIKFSHRADKFIDNNQISKSKVVKLIKKSIRYFSGKDTNIDIKKLKGKWKGFYRIRKGDIRIIAEFDFDNSAVFIEVIDSRGSIYK